MVGILAIKIETRREFDSIKKIIETGSGTMADVTLNQFSLRDLAAYET